MKKTTKKQRSVSKQKYLHPVFPFPFRTAPEAYIYPKSYDLAVCINFIANEIILATFL